MYSYKNGLVTSVDLKVFVSDDWYKAGSTNFVRNFYYQTFADINIACLQVPDPCDGVENCFNIVNGCAIAPSRNNLLATVPAALAYKASAEVFCDHSAPINWAWTAILRLGTGQDYGAAGDRTFVLFRSSGSNKVHFATNNPEGYDHHEFTEITCTDGQWSTYTIEVTNRGSGQLSYVASVDGATIMSGNYASSRAKTTGTLSAYVADNHYDPAPAYKVRNFFYQIF
ncbi:Oidioi.mRNA.OKI2018_I69.chr2.g4863.t1.cds [Oikopleura dioica]|uniref:Oidioi.mRNA.OKI2018_I69.chr2.g4863.t1.cds n=1 Tax=Oikopleura dioica TaxID=34765 RepID=A0ABN7T4C6_OIKDI|nr:Oidioi.mRNA.OKI2018_I69.chr2.g4863.t1.cds [Oikopleura dioica]